MLVYPGIQPDTEKKVEFTFILVRIAIVEMKHHKQKQIGAEKGLSTS